VFRVRVNQKVPFGTVIAYLQKNQDSKWSSSNFANEGSEKDDQDAYVVAGIFNVAGVNLKPYVAYTHNGFNHAYRNALDSDHTNDDAYNTNVVNLKFAADGKFGMFGFEGEAEYYNSRARALLAQPQMIRMIMTSLVSMVTFMQM